MQLTLKLLHTIKVKEDMGNEFKRKRGEERVRERGGGERRRENTRQKNGKV